jgi:hypothetical protein
MACSDFSAKRATRRRSPIDVSSSALTKLPVSPSLVAVVPRTIVRSPRPQPGKFVFSDPKRVLQHYPCKSRHGFIRRQSQWFGAAPASRTARYSNDSVVPGERKNNGGSFVVVQPVKWFKIWLWNFVGLAFQTCPFQCLRIARTAENHFLVPDQNYDVANLGRRVASDENLRGSELLSHMRTSMDVTPVTLSREPSR